MNPERHIGTPPREDSGMESFEAKAASYAELGQDGHGLGVWGDVRIEGEWLDFLDPEGRLGLEGQWLNLYTSPEIISRSFTEPILDKVRENPALREGLVIADAGGYDGFVLNTVVRQLEEAGIHEVTGINVEADPKGTALADMQAKIATGEYSEKLRAVRANIVDGVPLLPGSVDAVVSRCAIQYSQKEQHLQFMRNIANVLKEGGIAVLQFPGVLRDEEGTYTSVHREVSELITGGKEFRRDFPDSLFLERFMDDEELQQDVGLKALSVDTGNGWPMSPESWGNRFSLDEDQVEGIRRIYRHYQQGHPEMFEEVDGTLCLRTILERCELQKIASQQSADPEL